MCVVYLWQDCVTVKTPDVAESVVCLRLGLGRLMVNGQLAGGSRIIYTNYVVRAICETRSGEQ